MAKTLAAIAVVVSFALAPTSPLCEDGSWRRAHPLICDTGGTPGSFPGGGGGGGGCGIGCQVGRILNRITGGLL
jgi:hypothetical protein